MKLKHISIGKCPDCGGRVVQESQDRQHTNGDFFESVTFECGAVISYVPNFRRQQQDTACPNSPEAIAEDRRTLAAKLKLLKYIERLDVDDSYKKFWISNIR